MLLPGWLYGELDSAWKESDRRRNDLYDEGRESVAILQENAMKTAALNTPLHRYGQAVSQIMYGETFLKNCLPPYNPLIKKLLDRAAAAALIMFQILLNRIFANLQFSE